MHGQRHTGTASGFDIRQGFPESGGSHGAGTNNPIGFTAAEIDYIFYGIKTIRAEGSFDGCEDTTTALRLSFGPTFYPADGKRFHLLERTWDHVAFDADVGNAYVVLIQAGGVKADGLYWPILRLSCTPDNSADDFSSSSLTTLFPTDDPAGTLTFLGKSCQIYEAGKSDDKPARTGSVALTADETWVF